MRVQMVRIRYMGMGVLERRMVVGVTVGPCWHHVVGVQVVAVVMRMGVFVFQCFMVMRVAVRL